MSYRVCPRTRLAKRKAMNKHMILMLIGCVLPLLLIFLAPLIGMNGKVSLLIFIVAMFLCHLLMPMRHGGEGGHQGVDTGGVKK
jgi:hypothetical protein